MDPRTLEKIGPALAIIGSILSIAGTLFNNILLAHEAAMMFWMFSNPILLGWAWGYGSGHWDGGLSAKALGVMYLIFTVTNFYGLFVIGVL
jgi:hypothetical protein